MSNDRVARAMVRGMVAGAVGTVAMTLRTDRCPS